MARSSEDTGCFVDEVEDRRSEVGDAATKAASDGDRKLTYMYRKPVLLKPGRHRGIQFSPPPALTLPASKSMLKIRWRSPGCSECFLGRTTLTSRPAATMSPYRSSGERTFRRASLIIRRCVLRSRRHSREDSKVEGEPRVNPSDRPSRRTSVPCNGLLRSVDGLLENILSRLGNVRVDRICMYRDSS